MTVNQFTLGRVGISGPSRDQRKGLIKRWSEPRPGRMCNFPVVNLLTAKRAFSSGR